MNSMYRNVAIMIAACTALAFFSYPSSAAEKKVVAKQAAKKQGEISAFVRNVDKDYLAPKDGLDLTKQKVLNAGDTIKFKKGMIELQFRCNAQMFIQGPAELKVMNKTTCILKTGKITASITKVPNGFTINTPYANSISLPEEGSQIGVDVNKKNRTTTVHVFSGKTQVQPTRRDVNKKIALMLLADESVTVDSKGQLKKTAKPKNLSPSKNMQLKNNKMNLIATITNLDNYVMEKEDEKLSLGMLLKAGKIIRLKKGRVQFTFNNGATIFISGPTVLTLTNSNSCLLKSGKLMTRIPKSVKKFAIIASNATIFNIDEAEFGVMIDKKEMESSVHVFAGLVQVNLIEDGKKVITKKIGTAGKSLDLDSNYGFYTPSQFKSRIPQLLERLRAEEAVRQQLELFNRAMTERSHRKLPPKRHRRNHKSAEKLSKQLKELINKATKEKHHRELNKQKERFNKTEQQNEKIKDILNYTTKKNCKFTKTWKNRKSRQLN